MTDKNADIAVEIMNAVDEVFDRHNIEWMDAVTLLCGVYITLCADAAIEIENGGPRVRKRFMERCAEQTYDAFVAGYNDMERFIASDER